MLKLKRQVSSLDVVFLSKIKYNKTQINMPSLLNFYHWPTTEQPAKSPIGLRRLILIFSADFSVINIFSCWRTYQTVQMCKLVSIFSVFVELLMSI